MARSVRILSVAVLAILLGACAAVKSGKSPIPEVEGKTVHTQLNFWVVEGEHETTNYHMGSMIPVNSEVRIVDTTASTITGEVIDSGRRFTIINVAEYSKEDIEGIYNRYFDSESRNLGRFSGAEREAIKAGDIEKGMSKDAVLVARGYPPAHRTASTEMNSWRYWKGRHNTMVVRFDNGRVASITE